MNAQMLSPSINADCMDAAERHEHTPVKSSVRVVKCEVCSIKSVFKCAGCGCCYYCSKEHQRLDWKRHKRLCKVLIKKKLSAQSSFTKRKQNIKFGPGDCFINARDLSCYEELVAFVYKALMKTGLCVIDDYIHHNIAEGVMYETETLYRTPGVFMSADILDNNNGSCSSDGGSSYTGKKYRSDEIAWITGKEKLSKHIQVLCETFDNLIYALKFKGNSPTHKSKIQVSCFPSQSLGYVSHVDNPSDNGRLLTTVYHCNKHYNRELYGGTSRYYFRNGKFVDVEPKFNRAVIHWSDRRIIHETLPCRNKIFSLTSWYLNYGNMAARNDSSSIHNNNSRCRTSSINATRATSSSHNKEHLTSLPSSSTHSIHSRPKTKILYSADLSYAITSSSAPSSPLTIQNQKRMLEERKRHLVEDLEKFRRLANGFTTTEPRQDIKTVFTTIQAYPVLTKV